MDLKKTTKTELLAWSIVFAGLLCFIIYFCAMAFSGYKMFGNLTDDDIAVTGQIGDFFGGVVGSIWALAGVLLYFSALKLQNKQLVAQQLDMAQNKKLMSQQQFETTYFGLLRTQQELKSELKGSFYGVAKDRASYRISREDVETNRFFSRIMKEMRLLYNIYNREHYSSWEKDQIDQELDMFYQDREENPDDPDYDYAKVIREMFREFNLYYLTWRYSVKKETVQKAQNKESELLKCRCIYGHIFITYQEQLGHYFRHLYNIVKFLDRERDSCLDDIKDDINEELLKLEIERRFSGYFSFIHSMLPMSELAVLFYNSLLFPKAEKLYVKYHMFDNLLQGNLMDDKHESLIEGVTLKSNNDVFQDIIKDL